MPKFAIALAFAFTLLTLFVLTPVRGQEVERDWTDKSGKFKVPATLIETNEESVLLRKPNGDIVKIRLSLLSQVDIDFLVDNGHIAGVQQPAGEPEAADEQVDNATALVAARLDTEGKKIVFAGIPFSRNGVTEVVFPVPSQWKSHLNNSEQSDWSLQTDLADQESFVEPSSAAYLQTSQQLLMRSDKLQANNVVTREMAVVERGSPVIVTMAIPRQEAKPRVDVEVSESEIAEIILDDENRIVGCKLELEFPNENSFALISTIDNEVVGIALQGKANPVVNRRGQRGPAAPALVEVTPIKKYFDTDFPTIVNFGGYWKSGLEAEDPSPIELRIYLSTNEPLDPATVLKLKTMRAHRDVRHPTHHNMPAGADGLKIGPFSLTPVEEAPDYFVGPLNYQGSFKYLAKIKLDDVSAIKAFVVDGNLELAKGNEVQVSNSFSGDLWSRSEKQPRPFEKIESEYWQSPYVSFRADHPVTSPFTIFQYSDNRHPTPETSVDFLDEDGEEVSGAFQLDIGERPILAFSQDETIAWARCNESVYRLDLANKKVSHRFNIPESQSTSGGWNEARGICLTSAGLLVQLKTGLVLLDPESLETRRWISSFSLKDLVGSPESKYAFGFTDEHLWILNAETGLPEHRIKNEFVGSSELSHERARRRFSTQKITDLAITPNGSHLFARLSDHCCRFRIEGSDLIFEERTPVYLLERGREVLWLSDDGNYFSTMSGGTNDKKLLESQFGKGELDFVPGESAPDVFSATDFSKFVTSVQVESTDPNLYSRFAFDTLNEKFVVRKSKFGLSFANAVHFLPKTNLLVGAGIGNNRKNIVTIREVADEGSTATVAAKPTEVSMDFAGNSWNEAVFSFTELNIPPAEISEEEQKVLSRATGRNPAKPPLPEVIWEEGGEHFFLAWKNGIIRKVAKKTTSATLELNLGFPLYSYAKGQHIKPPVSITLTSQGLVAASGPAEKLVVIDCESLAIKKTFEVPLLNAVHGSPRHEFVICSLSNDSVVLFDTKKGVIVHQIETRFEGDSKNHPIT